MTDVDLYVAVRDAVNRMVAIAWAAKTLEAQDAASACVGLMDPILERLRPR